MGSETPQIDSELEKRNKIEGNIKEAMSLGKVFEDRLAYMQRDAGKLNIGVIEKAMTEGFGFKEAADLLAEVAEIQKFDCAPDKVIEKYEPKMKVVEALRSFPQMIIDEHNADVTAGKDGITDASLIKVRNFLTRLNPSISRAFNV